MDRVVVTGATGMLGIALIEECMRNKTHVLAIVRPRSPKRDRLPSSEFVRVVECDLSNLQSLACSDGINGKYEVFYHFGWQGTDKTDRYDPSVQLENVRYTLDAVRLAKRLGCGTFVGAGSQAEYGRVSVKLSPETPVNPDFAYGVAKYAAFKLSFLLAGELGMRHIWARVLSVYGPGDGENTMIMAGIRQLLSGTRPMYTKGEQLWDYLYCADAAEAFYRMGERTKHHAVYCLGSGVARPLREYIEIMRDAVDPGLAIGLGEVEYQKNQVMYLCADIDNLTNDTGFVPRTDFESGIRKTIKWVRESTGK